MTSTQPVRKRVFLPGTFQKKLARKLAAFWILYHLAMFHSLFFMDFVVSQAIFAPPGQTVSFAQHYLTFARQNWALVLWAVAIGPVFVWQFIRFSHHVAGPLVRLEKTLVQMAAGEPVRELKFREGDLTSGLEKAFNAYLASLHAQKDAFASDASVATAQNDLLTEIWLRDQVDSTLHSARGRDDSSTTGSAPSTSQPRAGAAESSSVKALDRVQQIVWEQEPFVYLVDKNSLIAVSPQLRNVIPAVLRPQAYWNIDQIQKPALVARSR